MSPRLLVWALNASFVLAALLWLAALAVVLGGPLVGEPLLSTWTVAREAGAMPVLAPPGEAHLGFDQGRIALLGADGWLWTLKLLDVLVAGAIALAALLLLRRFALDIRAGQPFADPAARRLRRLGGLLVAWPLWQLVHEALAQAWLLARAATLLPGTRLVHAFSPADAANGAVRLLAEPDLGYAVAGLVVLVAAHAFAAGSRQRQQLDEFV